MSQTEQYLPGVHDRAKHMRLDIARILKRFHFCERSITVAQAAWLASLAPIEVKITLPRFLWEDALTGDELRNRVFELRFPSRFLEVGNDAPVVDLFDDAINSPSPLAFILSLARVYKPIQLEAYNSYLRVADSIADGPSIRFLRIAVQDKLDQIQILEQFAQEMRATATDAEITEADAWVAALKTSFEQVGGLGLEPPTPMAESLTALLRKTFEFAEIPARDSRFQLCRFYWPNVIDADFPYGDGVLLQLRSAVSHLNEVWAVETGGAILYSFANTLDWEFILDAARWTYDEARHTRMGYERLLGWGFQPGEMPLGTYIFDSARGESPVIRIGMLHYFETKNIGKKTDRAAAFAQYHDEISQHDMEFDWADETIHAHYGSKWLKVLSEQNPDILDRDSLHERCDQLVDAIVATATDEDRTQIHAIAQAMIAKARMVAGTAS